MPSPGHEPRPRAPRTADAHNASPDGAAPEDAAPENSVGDLFGNITRDISVLVRQEMALARAELTHEAAATGRAAGVFGGSGLAAGFTLLFLSLALWTGLSTTVHAGWAALFIAALWALISGVLYLAGRDRFRRVDPGPRQTVDTLNQIPHALKRRRGAAR